MARVQNETPVDGTRDARVTQETRRGVLRLFHVGCVTHHVHVHVSRLRVLNVLFRVDASCVTFLSLSYVSCAERHATSDGASSLFSHQGEVQ